MTLEAGVLINQNVRLTRLLGKGGMGAVWLADHLTLRTQVAVKFILADFTSDADALDRFTREATSAAKIKSPNVVQVYDHGLFGGLPYIVMEYLEGEDLDARLTRAPLALGELAPILQQVGKALTQAHGLGIVHRDIKPANVYLTTAGDDLLVKLLDFGVAKSTRSIDDTSFKKTQTGQLIGTPCFMSPEQVFSRGAVDHRVDLWALAVLVYESLMGALPFEGQTLGDVYIAINSGIHRAPTSVNRAFPPELDTWFARAFAHDINGRFGTAREMCDAFLAVAARAPEARCSLISDIGSVPGMSGVSSPPVVASGPQADPHPTLGGTTSSSGSKKARSKLALSFGGLAVLACACAAAVVVLGRPPSTGAGNGATVPTVATTAPIAEPRSPVSASPAPEIVPAVVSAAAVPASASAPPAASAAPTVAVSHAVKSAPTAHAVTPPVSSAKIRDHGF
jgi:serine/threonine-protein kinase